MLCPRVLSERASDADDSAPAGGADAAREVHAAAATTATAAARIVARCSARSTDRTRAAVATAAPGTERATTTATATATAVRAAREAARRAVPGSADAQVRGRTIGAREGVAGVRETAALTAGAFEHLRRVERLVEQRRLGRTPAERRVAKAGKAGRRRRRVRGRRATRAAIEVREHRRARVRQCRRVPGLALARNRSAASSRRAGVREALRQLDVGEAVRRRTARATAPRGVSARPQAARTPATATADTVDDIHARRGSDEADAARIGDRHRRR